MGRKVIVVWLSLTLMLGLIIILVDITPTVKAKTIYVGGTNPGNYSTIQQGVDAAIDGDTVFVYSKLYAENVVINKSISLLGEDMDTTIIDSGGSGTIINIISDWVNISGFTLRNCGSTTLNAAIQISSFSNITITGNNISDSNRFGIYIDSASNNIVKKNIVSSSSWQAIQVSYSSDCAVIDNIVSSNNQIGVFLYRSSNTQVIDNNISSNSENGVCLVGAPNTDIINNTFTNDGIYMLGNELSHFNSHTISQNNTVNGKPLYYFKNLGDVNLDNIPVGQVILANCSNSILRNLKVNHTEIGIQEAYSQNTDIRGVNTSRNLFGIYIFRSSYSNITGCNIFSNKRDGIYLYESSNSIIDHNNITSNSGEGIFIPHHSKNNLVISNNMTNNYYGVHIVDETSNTNVTANNIYSNRGGGIRLELALNNFITGNNITNNSGHGINSNDVPEKNTISENRIISNNGDGIFLRYSHRDYVIDNMISSNNRYGIGLYYAYYNNIIGNTVWSNDLYGIRVSESASNRIYHNNIIDHPTQAYDNRDDNLWNDTYPSGGNYWSDFDEPGEGAYDDFKGSDQNVTGGDEIVDNGTIGGGGKNPYIIDSNSQDYYPLVSTIGNFTFLYQGWNLISIPFIQSDTNLDVAISSIRGSYDVVQWYNASDNYDHWKHNNTNKPDKLNDLDGIEHTMGFWIYITDPGGVLFEYSGAQPTSNQSILLHPGWNIVGYPSLTSYNRTEGLNNLSFDTHVDAIWTYNAATQKWKELTESDYFEIGKGYYIHAKEECTWEVPL